MSLNIPDNGQRRIVIVGGGFAGLELAKGLKKQPFQVVLLDRHNYHTFQPLLYQVATGGLEPDSIAYPIRKVFRKAPNLYFRMAEVERIVAEENRLETNIGDLTYDYLVLATGSKTNYFNFDKTKDKMMPLKSVPDALNLRSLILQNFEEATSTTNKAEQDDLINIAIVGGGPTGVELAGALGEMKKFIFPKDYPDLDLSKMRILLYEMLPRLLNGMSEKASEKALEYLHAFDVEVKLNATVSAYDGEVLKIEGEEEGLNTEILIWTAGVAGKMPEGIDKEVVVKGNRIRVNAYNLVDGYENIYAVGDIAAMIDEENPTGHPMLAPVAIQQGRHLAKNIKSIEKGKDPEPFKYFDKGTMATVGRNRAVVDLPNGWSFGGFAAWFTWMFVHILYLVGFRSKVSTFFDWVYNYFTYDRAMRLIIRPFKRNYAKKSSREATPVE